MADEEVTPLSTPTTNYGWAKPIVGGDGDVWGGQLNADLDGIDSTVKSVSNVAAAALPLAGGTLTGPVTLAADPAASLQAATKQYVDGGRLGDNRLINGDMRIDQRNNGASGTAIGVYTVDRWVYGTGQAGKGTWQRSSSAAMTANGFPYCLTFTSSSAYTALAADYFVFWQAIEADMISDFAWGTANAQPVTFSFWAMATKTGAFSGSIANYAGTRSYPFTFNIAVASTWQKFSVTIPGDTAGTWVMSGNAASVVIYFDLGCGANFRATAGAWAAGNYLGVTGAQSIVATNGAITQITGVKLEIGSIATPFNRQSLAKSLADCQRYYAALGGHMVVAGYAAAGITIWTPLLLPVQMRAAPSVTYSSVGYGNASNLLLNASNTTQVTNSCVITAVGAGYAAALINANAEL